MLFDLDRWAEVAASLRKHRLRTWLTGLGVFLGILILLTMVAFGRSLRDGVGKQMAGFATNAVFVWGQRTSEPFAGLGPNRQVSFRNADIPTMTALPGVAHVAPRNQLGGFMSGSNVRRGAKTGSFQVSGDYPAFQYVQTPMMRAGRFLNDADLAERRKVCVVGENIIDQLFTDGAEPIGAHLEINGIYFQIVGVFGTRAKGQQADRVLNTIHIPFTTFQQAFNFGDRVSWFAIAGQPSTSAEALEEAAKAALMQRHQIAPTDTQAIGAFNAGREFSKVSSLFRVIDAVMWFAGLMTLAAGVIGVSNIMLISVRERTKEIGVRKALGATPRVIQEMIIAEAVVLTSIAGYLGIVASVAAMRGLNAVLGSLGGDLPFGAFQVDLGDAVGAGLVVIFFGVLAGLIPARLAARVQPVEALRAE